MPHVIVADEQIAATRRAVRHHAGADRKRPAIPEKREVTGADYFHRIFSDSRNGLRLQELLEVELEGLPQLVDDLLECLLRNERRRQMYIKKLIE